MNEQQLRYIRTIAEEGSIVNASHLLGKNPSTLTRVLKSCEEELSLSLFKRTRRGMVPTPEGERVAELSGEILSQLHELKLWAARRNRDSRQGETPDGSEAGKAVHSFSEQELRCLLAVREHKNISRAAKELYIAQPSLSQTIKDLEEDFESPIFIRQKNGVKETEFGFDFLNRLEAVRDTYEELWREAEELCQMKKGIITFGIPMNLGTYLLPMIVPTFRQRFPGIKIQIREHNSSELERLMIAGKLDFCILHFHERLKQVEYEMFFEDPFCLVVPGGLRTRFDFPKNKRLDREDLKKLAGESFVMVAGRQKLRQVADEILKNAEMTPDICCTTKSMETAKRLVAAGMGVTFLPRSYLNLYSGVEGLECYEIDGSLKGIWKLTVAYLRERKLSRGSKEFLKILKEALKEMSQT